MDTITVTIGRNYRPGGPNPNEPMPDNKWALFQATVRDALDDMLMNSVANGRRDMGMEAWQEKHYGTGTWDGVTEESCKITLMGDSLPDRHSVDARVFLATLPMMVHLFDQDAVAVAWGTSELVER